MEANKMCKIPVEATYRIIDGKPVLIDAVYEDIPADAIARFLLEKCGVTPIFGGGDRD